MRKGILKEHHRLIDLCKRCMDILIVTAIGYSVYFYIFQEQVFASNVWGYLPTGILLAVICFNTISLYKAWRGIDLFSELIVMFYAWMLPCAVLLLITFFTEISSSSLRVWIFYWFVFCLLFLAIYRICLKLILNYFRRIGFNQRSVCLLSYGLYGENMYEIINRKPIFGFNILAVFADKVDDRKNIYGNKLKGKIKDCYEWLILNEIEQVWIIAPLEKIKIVKKIMSEMKNLTVDIRFFPDMNSFNLINHSVSEVCNMPCFDLSMSPMANTGNKLLKRIEDLFIGVILLILSSPIMFLIYAVMKITSSKPVFYKQVRVGFNNKTFRMYKYRTMPINIENETGAVWAKTEDKRATVFGSFLRKTSLDELPQLFNVIKGNMSLVGPRPERPEFVEKFKDEIPLYMKKHIVKAGITGWAQINGYRGNTDLKKRIEYDIYYINNWSLLFDVKILIITLFKGFINKNAY
jgi:putative colanic acid biosysnthesis UDP-glucose lipid carrier transferase